MRDFCVVFTDNSPTIIFGDVILNPDFPRKCDISIIMRYGRAKTLIRA